MNTKKRYAADAVCTVDGCNNPRRTRAWCRRHYRAWRVHGDPLFPMKLYGDPVTTFWGKVNKDGPIHHVCGQCWVWTGGRIAGYGVIGVNGQSTLTHRFSWSLHFGNVPKSDCVLHRCDTRLCVNPSHLFLGSRTDNAADMVEKGRQCRGERHRKARFTNEQVLEIRNRYSATDRANGLTQLRREFNCSPGTIIAIVNRVTWKHI